MTKGDHDESNRAKDALGHRHETHNAQRSLDCDVLHRRRVHVVMSSIGMLADEPTEQEEKA